jgi:putative transposase
MTEDWLGKWAVNQMLINVSTRKFKRSVRLAEGEVPAPKGSGLSKSAASQRFVALSAARLKEWMARDLSGLGLRVIQIDGIHTDEDMTLVAAIGVDAKALLRYHASPPIFRRPRSGGPAKQFCGS